ncbi:MAG TPA: prephenate dehydrogenase/arogenate dehydrogenase family protein [Chloroflexi bacterium]|nr:prephenate dehydrogenase/arogenate dehydrogenase family protein [Chloroflexota bacterium]HHW89249.1 prephenate dehydrogenase [Chloroflexota bacterium]
MTKPLKDCSVAVVGLGLMGASLCMDLKEGGLCREVRGVARRTRTVLDAFFAGAVDLATNDLQTGVLGADIVILATPVRTIISTLAEIGPRLWPGALVMDMGSTKGDICAAMAHLPAGVQPVGGHPMCGKETAGFEAAECGLYRNATWVLSPLPRTSPDALALATELAQAVGARPLVLAPDRHDRLVASISHLPFLLASALTAAVAEVGADDPTVWDVAAGGFRDTSRVAASDTQMFLDILMTNRAAVLAQVERFQAHLGALHDLLANNDEAALRTLLSASQQARAGWKPRRA